MTTHTLETDTAQSFSMNVVGPFSPWPRRKMRLSRKSAAITGVVAVAAAFAHCGLPMIA